MKYTKGFEGSPVQEWNIEETITEIEDVVVIAKSVSENLSGDVSAQIKKELDLIIKNLSSAESYLPHLRRKTKIALRFVPKDIQEKEYL